MRAQLDPNMWNTHVNHYTVEPQPHAGGLFGSKQVFQAGTDLNPNNTAIHIPNPDRLQVR